MAAAAGAAAVAAVGAASASRVGSAARIALLAGCLSGCVYAPPMQRYPFERHPGVYLEVWWSYDAYGGSFVNSKLVNGSSVDKCAWTDALDSRVLRAGEAWQLSHVQSPGGVGVTNVSPLDPNCARAKRDHGIG